MTKTVLGFRCSICDEEFQGIGNNASPFKGVCCDSCKVKVVEGPVIAIKRQPTDYRTGFVLAGSISGLRWDDMTGGVFQRTGVYPYGYVSCADIVDGEIGHSCRHGQGPHSIKVCVIKKSSHSIAYKKLVEPLGTKPKKHG
jgi:hypothetical protein